jgi:hypothetical protein
MPELSRENLEKQSTSSEEENLYVEKSILTEKELIEESGLPAEKWTENYGGRFRRIIRKNPELLNNIDEIRKELYKEKIH